MGRTLTATFTLESDIFVSPPLLTFHPHPVCAPGYQQIVRESPRNETGFLPAKKETSGIYSNERKKSPRREYERCGFVPFSCILYPSGFAFCAKAALRCGRRQHPHRHLPLGARLLSSGGLDRRCQRGGGFTHRAARRGGTSGRETRGCEGKFICAHRRRASMKHRREDY